MPTQHGEGGGAASLNQAMGLQPLESLGMPEDIEQRFRKLIGARRHGARHGAHRQRQDDDAVFGAQYPEQTRHQDHHGRGPGRISARSHHPGADQGEDRARLQPRAALGAAPRSGHHLHRRNARPRDRRYRPARRDHGPSGVLDAAHHECRGDDRSADRHGRARLHGGGRRARRARAAAGAPDLRRLREPQLPDEHELAWLCAQVGERAAAADVIAARRGLRLLQHDGYRGRVAVYELLESIATRPTRSGATT
jgi:hypothetical protein